MTVVETSLNNPGPTPKRPPGGGALPDPASTQLRTGVVVGVSLLLLLLVGGWLRFANLGELTAQVDEGFQALAVEAILEHGYPKLDTGFVYGRSPLFLYAQAGSAWLFGLSEWSLRFPSAVFGLLGIPVAYVLGRKLFDNGEDQKSVWLGVGVGLVLAAMFAVSAWQLEYARYGRFYTLFQLFYMLGVIAFLDGYLRGRTLGKLLFWVFFVLTVSVHDLGVMLGLCFWAVIPLRGYRWSTKLAHFVGSIACAALWVGYTKLWRGAAAAWSDVNPDRNPTGLAEVKLEGDGLFSTLIGKLSGVLPGLNLPDFRLLEAVWARNPWVLALVALPGVLATGLLAAAKLRELAAKRNEREGQATDEAGAVRGRLWLPLLLTAVWAATLQQFALAGVALLVYAAFHVRSWRQWLRRNELVTLGSCFVAMTLWVLYFWSSDAVGKHVWVPAVTNLPAVHNYFLQWFVPGWTRMFVLLIPAAYVVARWAARGANGNGRGNGAWLLLVAIAAPILVTSELRWQFSESRYFFHLYPLILAVLAAGVVALGVWVGQRVAAERLGVSVFSVLVVAALVFAGTKDLNPAEAWAVTARTHQSTKDPVRSVINFPFYAYWPQDQKSATLAAVDQVGPEDHVMVVGPVHVSANYRYYLGRVDSIASTSSMYSNARAGEDGRWIDLVTDGEVVSSAGRLMEIAADTQRRGGALWVFSDTVMVEPRNWYLSDAEPELKEAVAALTAQPMLTGKDGRTVVARVTFPAAMLAEALDIDVDDGIGDNVDTPQEAELDAEGEGLASSGKSSGVDVEPVGAGGR